MSTAKQKAAAKHARSFLKRKKGKKLTEGERLYLVSHKKGKSNKHRKIAKAGSGNTALRYQAIKGAYHRAGTELFKSRHGGKTAKEWAKTHKKAKHKKSR